MKEWKCHYCKKKFESLFSRDFHHRTHVEHYKYLFENCMEIITRLEIENNDLKQELKGVE